MQYLQTPIYIHHRLHAPVHNSSHSQCVNNGHHSWFYADTTHLLQHVTTRIVAPCVRWNAHVQQFKSLCAHIRRPTPSCRSSLIFWRRVEEATTLSRGWADRVLVPAFPVSSFTCLLFQSRCGKSLTTSELFSGHWPQIVTRAHITMD